MVDATMVDGPLATFGVLSASPLFWNFPTAFLKGAAAAAGIAIINSIANLGGFVIPFLVGSIKDATGSTAIGMYFIAALLFGGAVLAVAVRFADRQKAAPLHVTPVAGGDQGGEDVPAGTSRPDSDFRTHAPRCAPSG